MNHESKLPALVPPRNTTASPNPGPRPTPPDDLDRAIAALRQSLEAEVGRPRLKPGTAHSQRPDRRPDWRAGSDLPRHSSDSAQHPLPQKTAQNSGPALDRPQLTRRVTVLHFPRFSMERWLRAAQRRGEEFPDDLAIALAVEGAHGPVIHATNRAAEQQGVQIGSRVVDMRALCPDLHLDFADTRADLAALDRLVLWARRWCPWTARDGNRGIVMDTTGSDHLLGGEAAMLREIEERLSALGLSSTLAVAPTHGAAWALARFGTAREICAAPDLPQRMARLPVKALRLTGDTVLLLQRLGLKTVGDLATVPRLSLARRFSRAPLAENPLLRLDQMMGRLAEPISAPEDPPRFAVQSRLAEPVQDPTAWLPDLCLELCGGMAAAGYGARRLRVTVYRTDGEVSWAEVATARPSRDASHLRRLFDGKLDRIDPGFGFDLVTLSATVVEKLQTIQTRLDRQADDGAELGKLVDRLTARLGGGALRMPTARSSHIPERAENWTAATAEAPPPVHDAPSERPLRLFDHPEEVRVLYAVPEGPPAQFVWRRLTFKVSRFAGPERVAPEWWADLPGTRLRDYYRVETHIGRRIWLYRNGVLGDGRGDIPRWFVHGVFA